MNQEIEIEFKNLLTKQEYVLLCDKYSEVLSDKKIQTNFYFDDEQMSLKEHGSALRIREKSGKYVLTFKQPHKEGLLETHQSLTGIEKENAVHSGSIPKGDVLNQIQALLNRNDIHFNYLGELTTIRMEGEVEGGLLVLDQSKYFDITDYELEFECNEAEPGKQAFNTILATCDIPIRPTPNKIRRFFEEKIKKDIHDK
ncbi:CYTH domain-containing protein [Bacillus shivajii]|uniref:CYTH domain-containing protein n=1 Tax=Bacillus shivajii TaxID=1983719 RepID=UPI001CFBE449|nr:CYTH domain-containing protein [Bacillus shivajii]UCZ51948.1 CYTH domain-containing protein [Bacillus shivajii]